MEGKDKPLMRLAGKSLLEHVIARLAPQVSALVLNANGDASRFGAFGLTVIADPVAAFAGPLAGILAGVEWAAANKADRVLTVPADTPFLPRDLTSRLEQVWQGNDIACTASSGRIHPVVGLWPTRLAGELRHALISEHIRKVDAWTARFRVGIAEWPDHPYDPFFNINRPPDLIEAEQILSEFSP